MLYDNAPIPPVTAIWRRYHHPSVAGLDQPFWQRIAEFRRLRREANHLIELDNPEGEDDIDGVPDLDP